MKTNSQNMLDSIHQTSTPSDAELWLRAHLDWTDLRDSATCSYAAPQQTPQHIPEDCPEFVSE